MLARFAAFVFVAALVASPAFADSWKDESGKGRHGGHKGEWKEEYRDGHCKIERKWKRGEYKEEIKCDGGHWGYARPPVIVHRAPVVVRIELPPLPVGPSYGAIFGDEHGRYCREYQMSGLVDGRRQPLYGTVCLHADGAWSFND
jgi:hypothetical protein